MKLIEYELSKLGYLPYKHSYRRKIDHHSLFEEHDRVHFHFSVNRFIFQFFLFFLNDCYILIPRNALHLRV